MVDFLINSTTGKSAQVQWNKCITIENHQQLIIMFELWEEPE